MRERKEEREGEKEGRREEVKKKGRKLFSIIYLKCQGIDYHQSSKVCFLWLTLKKFLRAQNSTSSYCFSDCDAQ